jgi:hypothetical protein
MPRVYTFWDFSSGPAFGSSELLWGPAADQSFPFPFNPWRRVREEIFGSAQYESVFSQLRTLPSSIRDLVSVLSAVHVDYQTALMTGKSGDEVSDCAGALTAKAKVAAQVKL